MSELISISLDQLLAQHAYDVPQPKFPAMRRFGIWRADKEGVWRVRLCGREWDDGYGFEWKRLRSRELLSIMRHIEKKAWEDDKGFADFVRAILYGA